MGRTGELQVSRTDKMQGAREDELRGSRKDELQGSLLIVVASVFFGLAGTAARKLFVTGAASPLVVVECRLASSFLILLLVLSLVAPQHIRVRREHLRYFLVYGILGMGCVQLSFYTALSQGSVSTAIFLQYLAPVFSAVYFSVAQRRLPERHLLRSIAIATSGLVFLLLGGGGMSTTPVGFASGIMSAGFLSFYTIYGAIGLQTYAPQTMLLWSCGFASLFLMTLKPPWTILRAGLQTKDWLYIGFIAIFGTLIPMLILLQGIKRVPALRAILVMTLEPVLATAFAWLLLSESLHLLQVAGGTLIIVAVVLLQARQAMLPRLPSGTY
ncbi:MAG: DMT family transporter [Bacillota bacterium]|nr:DMT family transporter [Bacillota bacterium]